MQLKNGTICPFPTGNSPTFPVPQNLGQVLPDSASALGSHIQNFELVLFPSAVLLMDFLLPLGICVASRHCKLICLSSAAGKIITNDGNDG